LGVKLLSSTFIGSFVLI